MTRDKILQSLYEDDIYKGYAASFCPNLVDEMISELVFRFLNMKEDKLLRLYNDKELKVYALAILRNMVYYKYDPFRKQYLSKNKVEIKDDILSLEDEVKEDISEENTELRKGIDKFLSNRSSTIPGEWYNEKLFNMYYLDDMTYKEISKDTGISQSSIFLSVKQTKEVVNTKFKSYYYDFRK